MSKTVLITGASQGIGAVLAVHFAKSGYNVAINCYNQEAADTKGADVAKECIAAGVQAQCFVGDVSKFADCEAMVTQVVETFGAIDVLINNAGITRDGLLPRMKEQDFDDVINVNLKSVFNMCRQVTPLMMKKRSGWIINMSSIVGVCGNAGQTNYAASKAGLIGFSKSLAKELGGRGIICNAIAPGFIESAMTDVLPDKVKEQMLSSIALRRLGTAQDIAETALFLATTTYITGQVLVVDGGMAM